MPEFIQKCCRCVPHRVTVCALVSGVMMFAYLQRITFNLCLREMVRQTPPDYGISVSNCNFTITTSVEHREKAKFYFFWEEKVQRATIQFFYLGYLTAVIPSGLAVDFYGGKTIFLYGLLASSLATLSLPKLAYIGPHELMAGRLFQGLAQGMLYPSLSVLAAEWAPVSERTRFVSIAETGKLMGFIITVYENRVLPYLEGKWEVKLYVAGVLGVLWSAVTWVFLCDRPATCSHITTAEMTLIQLTCEGLEIREERIYPFVPWGRMFTSTPFLSLLIYSSSLDLLHNIMFNNYETYMVYVIHVDPHMAYFMFDIVIISTIVSTVFWGVASDWLINKNFTTRDVNRKLTGCLAVSVTTPFYLLTFVAGCDDELVVALQVVSFFAQGLVYCNQHALPIDLSPQHAGVVEAVASFAGYSSAALGLEMFNGIVREPSDPRQWLAMGCVTMVLVAVCTLQFLWLGSATVQPWNYELRLRVRSRNPQSLLRSQSRSVQRERRSE